MTIADGSHNPADVASILRRAGKRVTSIPIVFMVRNVGHSKVHLGNAEGLLRVAPLAFSGRFSRPPACAFPAEK